jgi:thymidylate kinase
MVRFPTFYLNLEGPDRSGKTTMYSQLHNATDYRWNIHDRSAISMLVFSDMYKRDSFHNIENVKKELFNLNNRFLILMPEWDEISQRNQFTPDELHTIISLKKVYNAFEKVAEEFENFPNVIVVRSNDASVWISDIVNNMTQLENSSYLDIQKQVMQLCEMRGGEAIGVNFTLFDNGTFQGIDDNVSNYPKEKDYYKRINTELSTKINLELSSGQTKESRRFVYADDSCISLAHFNYRKGELDCNIVLRSSDVADTLYYDLNFAMIMCRNVFNTLGLSSESDFCRVRFEINSAHIPSMVN